MKHFKEERMKELSERRKEKDLAVMEVTKNKGFNILKRKQMNLRINLLKKKEKNKNQKENLEKWRKLQS